VVENEHVVLMDFGKAVKLSEAKMYHLGEIERQEYISKYPHLAPEVVYGQKKTNQYTVIFMLSINL
jgi:serine/threonine protein kinase